MASHLKLGGMALGFADGLALGRVALLGVIGHLGYAFYFFIRDADLLGTEVVIRRATGYISLELVSLHASAPADREVVVAGLEAPALGVLVAVVLVVAVVVVFGPKQEAAAPHGLGVRFQAGGVERQRQLLHLPDLEGNVGAEAGGDKRGHLAQRRRQGGILDANHEARHGRQ